MRVDLRKSVETISWSDEPGSKEYEIDMTDEGLLRMKHAIDTVNEALKDVSKDKAGSAAAIKEFVTAVAGEECYEDALAYVDTRGVGAEGCVASMVPLVVALADYVTDHLASLRVERIEHYMRLGNAQADLV